MELTQDEKLAYLIALKKSLDEALEDIKLDYKTGIETAYEQFGMDRKAILVGGQKVGEVRMNYNAAGPEIKPEKQLEATEYLMQLGLCKTVPVTGWKKRFYNKVDQDGIEHVIDLETGEDVSELFYWTGKTPKYPVIDGCKPEEVSQAFGNRLPKPTQLLLTGEVE